MTIQDQIKTSYGIYEERVLRGGLAEEPKMSEVVPQALSVTGATYNALDVVVRMLSIYDGCHGIYRDLEMYTATVLHALGFGPASRRA